MITRRDLDEQIEYIKGKINQTPEECVRLAAYYTIRDHLDGVEMPQSYGAAPPAAQTAEVKIGDYGDTEFLQMIAGMDAAHVWSVMAEAMETLRVMQPRFYDGILRKLQK